VLRGTTVHVPIYADATYLFIFRNTASGMAVAINTLCPTGRRVARAPTAAWSRRACIREPADILLQPIFQSGRRLCQLHCAAAFVLILHQILLIGASLLTVVRGWHSAPAEHSRPCSAAALRI